MSFLNTYHVCFSVDDGNVLRDTTVEIPSDTNLKEIPNAIRAKIHPDIDAKGMGPEEGSSQRSRDCVIVTLSLLGQTRKI